MCCGVSAQKGLTPSPRGGWILGPGPGRPGSSSLRNGHLQPPTEKVQQHYPLFPSRSSWTGCNTPPGCGNKAATGLDRKKNARNAENFRNCEEECPKIVLFGVLSFKFPGEKNLPRLDLGCFACVGNQARSSLSASQPPFGPADGGGPASTCFLHHLAGFLKYSRSQAAADSEWCSRLRLRAGLTPASPRCTSRCAASATGWTASGSSWATCSPSPGRPSWPPPPWCAPINAKIYSPCDYYCCCCIIFWLSVLVAVCVHFLLNKFHCQRLFMLFFVPNSYPPSKGKPLWCILPTFMHQVFEG